MSHGMLPEAKAAPETRVRIAKWLLCISVPLGLFLPVWVLLPDQYCYTGHRNFVWYNYFWDTGYNLIGAFMLCGMLELFVFANLVSNWNNSLRIQLYGIIVTTVLACSFGMKHFYQVYGLTRASYAQWLFRFVVIFSCFMGYCVQVPFVFYYNRNEQQRRFFLCKVAQFMICFICGMVLYYFSQAYVVLYKLCQKRVIANSNHLVVSIYDFISAHMFTNVWMPLFLQLIVFVSKPCLNLAQPVHRERLLLALTSWVECFIAGFGRIVFANVASTKVMVILILKDNLSHALDFGIRYSPDFMVGLLMKRSDETGTFQKLLHSFLKCCDIRLNLCAHLLEWPADRVVGDDSVTPGNTLHQAYLDSPMYRKMHEATPSNTAREDTEWTENTTWTNERTDTILDKDDTDWMKSHPHLPFMQAAAAFGKLAKRSRSSLKAMEPVDFGRCMRREEYLASKEEEAISGELENNDEQEPEDDNCSFGQMSMSFGVVSDNIRFLRRQRAKSNLSHMNTKGMTRMNRGATLKTFSTLRTANSDLSQQLSFSSTMAGDRTNGLPASAAPNGSPAGSPPNGSPAASSPISSPSDSPLCSPRSESRPLLGQGPNKSARVDIDTYWSNSVKAKSARVVFDESGPPQALGGKPCSQPLPSDCSEAPLLKCQPDESCPVRTVTVSSVASSSSRYAGETDEERAANQIQAVVRGTLARKAARAQTKKERRNSCFTNAQLRAAVGGILPPSAAADLEEGGALCNRVAYGQRYLRLRYSGVMLPRLVSSIVGVVVIAFQSYLPCTVHAYGWHRQPGFRDALSWAMFMIGDLLEAYFILRNFRVKRLDQAHDAGNVFTQAVLWKSGFYPFCLSAVIAHVITDAYLSAYRLHF